MSQKKANPVLIKKYQEGYTAGFQEGQAKGHIDGMIAGKKAAAALLSVKIERIAKIKGIGPAKIKQIFDALDSNLTPEEQQEYNEFLSDLLNGEQEK